MKELKQKSKGITLITLVITIVILLIIAGIALSFSIGNNGIIQRALQAREKSEQGRKNEEKVLNDLYSQILIASNENSQVTVTIEDLKKIISENSNPTGTVISYMGNSSPTGYLICDGTEYNISEYKNLAEQIKNEFGEYNYYGGDGETTFAVPDLRGEFLRGTGTATRNTGTGIDVGQHQDATNHMATYTASGGHISWPYMGAIDTSNSDTILSSSSKRMGVTSNATGTWAGQTKALYTSRPTNTSVLYCIKY